MQRTFIFAAAFMLALPSTAYAEGQGQIRIAIKADIRGTNPGVDRDATTDDVLHHVAEGLVAYREDMTVGPLLADAINVSPDGLAYSFTLRDGVTFHNGAAVTADHVVWSWQRYLDPQTGWRCTTWYDGTQGLKIEAVEAADADTVRFTLNRPDPVFLERMANLQCMSPILHPSSVDPQGGWAAPVGTGPYRLADWKRGQYILLERHDGYLPRSEPKSGLTGAREPLAASLKWMVIPDPAAAKAALYAGQVDLVYGGLPSDVDELKRARDITLHAAEGLEWNTLLVQTADPLFQDERIRKAIGLALDLPNLAGAASFGISQPNPSVIPRSSVFHTPAQDAGHGYDIAAAKRLLKEAGYRGQKIVIQTNKRYQNMFDVALMTQAMLQAAGMNVELQVLEWATQLNNYLEGDFQLMAFGYSARPHPAFAYEALIGDKTKDGWAQWDDDVARSMLVEAKSTTDSEAQSAIFDRMHERLIAQAPIYNLFNQPLIEATGKRIDGYRPWTAAKPRLWGVRVVE